MARILQHPLTRRQLIRSIAGCAALGSLGLGASRARAAAGERKFLFFFASGGWDATPLDPKYAEDGIRPVAGTDMDPDTWRAEAGQLSWSAGADREGMDRFFSRWYPYVAMLRGVNVHSAGHDSAMKWMMTGTSASSVPDWPAAIAAHGVGDYPMPHLVFGGPSYPGAFGAAVVRGGGGTLLDLIDGSILGDADSPAPVVPAPMDSMMDAFVHRRVQQFATDQGGLGLTRSHDLLQSVERAMELEGRRFEAGLSDSGGGVLDQALMALEVMRLGLSRCAMVSIPGGWDTHGGNQAVGGQLHDFFTALDAVMEALYTTPGSYAPWMIDEVTVVVTSELGRTPLFNGSMGRDHWPYTSMLAMGSGIAGNAVYGETDEGLISLPVDLGTGRASTSAEEVLGCEHVGVSLLRLGGVDPELYLPGVPGLDALQRGA